MMRIKLMEFFNSFQVSLYCMWFYISIFFWVALNRDAFNHLHYVFTLYLWYIIFSFLFLLFHDFAIISYPWLTLNYKKVLEANEVIEFTQNCKVLLCTAKRYDIWSKPNSSPKSGLQDFPQLRFRK